MIKRKLTVCCDEFEQHKELFAVVVQRPFSLQAVLRLGEKEIEIDYCPFCGHALPKYIDSEE